MASGIFNKVPWGAIATLAIGLLLTLLARGYIADQEVRQQQNQSDAASSIIASNVELHLRYREQSLERMALRLQRDVSLDRNEWESDASFYLKAQPGYHALVVLRFDRKERWSVPPTTAAHQDRIKAAFPPSSMKKEPTAEDAAKAHIRRSVTLSSGERIMPIAYPLYSNNKLFGYLVAFIHIEELFDSFLKELSGVLPSIAVKEDGIPIYQRGESGSSPSSTVHLDAEYQNLDLNWTITTQVNPLAATQGINVKPLVLFLGTAISLALSMIVLIMRQNTHNLNERVLAERNASESSRFLDLIMKHTPDLIFVKDEKFRLVLANPAMLALYPEQQRDRIIGTTTIEDYDAKEAEEFLRYDRIAFLEGHSETEETIHFPDGQVETLLTTKIRFYDHKQQPFILGVGRKISDLKRAHNELLRSNRELDNFAHIASHDLKAPLRGIRNHVRFLREDYETLLDESGLYRLDRLSYLTQRMEKLIVDLLSYSRLGRGKDITEETNLNEIVSDIARQYEADEVELSILDTLPVMECNSQRITELLHNLIDNSVKYNNSELKQIRVECQFSNAIDGNGLLFSVSDNGIGIEPKFHNEIFTLFKRLHSQDAYGGGTGSGLTFVKRIVSLYDGDVWLSSESDKGSTFFFTLPDARVIHYK